MFIASYGITQNSLFCPFAASERTSHCFIANISGVIDANLFVKGNYSAIEKEQYIAEYVKQDFKNVFNEKEFPLWRIQICILDKDNVYALLTSHHAIFDGWSVNSFLVELMELYYELQSGKRTTFG